MSDARAPRFFPNSHLLVCELLCLFSDLHSLERFRRHEHTQHFSNVIGTALPDGEERWTVVECGDLGELADGDFVVAAQCARCGEDEIRLAERAVGVLFAIDDVEVSAACGFDADAKSIAGGESSVGRDALR